MEEEREREEMLLRGRDLRRQVSMQLHSRLGHWTRELGRGVAYLSLKERD